MLITKLIWPWFLWALLATVHCCVVFEPGVGEPMFLETLEAGDKGIKRSGAAFLQIVPMDLHRDRPSKRNYRWRIIVSGRNPEGSVWFQQEWRNIRGNLAQGRMWQGHDSLLFFVFGFKIPRGKTCINLVSFLSLQELFGKATFKSETDTTNIYSNCCSRLSQTAMTMHAEDLCSVGESSKHGMNSQDSKALYSLSIFLFCSLLSI